VAASIRPIADGISCEKAIAGKRQLSVGCLRSWLGMISTRLHGFIDYAVALLLGGLSASRSLSPPVRSALGSAGAYHAGYSALTDYEAGLRPWLTMRQHLVLDALGAAALCGAGLLMRRQRPGERALLVAVGLSELAVVASSRAMPVSVPGDDLIAEKV
jgi:hypothetical protein